MNKSVREWVGSLADVRPEERKPVGLMVLYGFLALTSFWIIKPARNAVFVERLGTENLPWVYIVTAVFIFGVMILYSRWVDRIRPLRLLLGTLAFLASNLVLFRWLLQGDSLATSGVFYVWGKIYPLLLVSQFWLVVNLLFTTRQAKRLFGFIGVGLILGGVAGSGVAAYLAQVVGTENLLLISAGLLLVCGILMGLIGSHLEEAEGEEEDPGGVVRRVSGDALRILRESSHLRTLALILCLTILAETLVDWQFNRAVEIHITGEDGKAAFYGAFFAMMNGASVGVQLLFTSFVLRRFGVGVALLVLPVSILGAAGVAAVAPALLSAVMLKGTEGTFRYSLDQSTRELLYLPVPTDLKYKVKPFIDLAVHRVGTGVAGVVLLVLVNVLGYSIQGVAVATVVVVVAWIGATFRMRSEFRRSVKHLIGVRDVEVQELVDKRLDADTLREVRIALESGSEEEVRFALSLLRFRKVVRFTDEVVGLLQHETSDIRARAILALVHMEYGDAVDQARALLVDDSLSVRVAAMHYVTRFGPDEGVEEIKRFLEHEEHGVQAAAVALILLGGTWEELLDEGQLEDLIAHKGLESRISEARALVEAGEGSIPSMSVLESLLHDSDAEVRQAAMQAAGLARYQRFLPLLIDRLLDPDDRKAAIEALSECAPGIQRRLVALLRADDSALGLRLTIPTLLVARGDQEGVELLLESLPDADPRVRFEILKALNRLRRDRGEELDFSSFDVESLLEKEIRQAYIWAHRLHGLQSRGPCHPLLARTLKQRREECVERAFRLLGMGYPLEDLQAAFRAAHASEGLMRERGWELTENTLDLPHRDRFDPILDPERTLEEVARAAEERFERAPRTREETLQELEALDDPWVNVLVRLERGAEIGDAQITPRTLQEKLAPMVFLARGSLNETEVLNVMEIVERAETLSRSKVFGEMRGEELAAIAALMEERTLEEGEEVQPTSPLESELLVVRSGRLAAVRDDKVLFTAGPSEAYLDPSFLDGCATEARIVALEETEVLALSRGDFFLIMEERFQVVRGVLAHVGVLVRESSGEKEEEVRRRSKRSGDDPCVTAAEMAEREEETRKEEEGAAP